MNKLQLIGRDGPSFLPPTGGSGAPTWKCAQVLKLRKGGMSLRIITEDMNLGLQTVRTIIGRVSTGHPSSSCIKSIRTRQPPAARSTDRPREETVRERFMKRIADNPRWNEAQRPGKPLRSVA
jgi:hypothetical protein